MEWHTINLARIVFAILLLLTLKGAHAQEIPNHEPDAKISYDRFENKTWYEMDSLTLAPWNGKSDYSGLSPQLHMSAQFGCYGDNGESPCVPNQIALDFSYSNFFSRGEYTYKYPPFDYQQRSVIAITDGKRIPLGILSVSRKSESGYISVRGILPLSLQTFRQLASANSVEMKVGILPVTLTSGNLDTLASFYNFAVLNKRTPATNTNRTPARRSKRRARRP